MTQLVDHLYRTMSVGKLIYQIMLLTVGKIDRGSMRTNFVNTKITSLLETKNNIIDSSSIFPQFLYRLYIITVKHYELYFLIQQKETDTYITVQEV